jgi:transcriptional regulator with XRE-family HTH domain
MSDFSERLKILRTSNKLSQQQLADNLKVSRSIIGMYELGSRKPSFIILETIADYFNVDFNYLIGKSNIPNKYQIENNNLKPEEKNQASKSRMDFYNLIKNLNDDEIEKAQDVLEAMFKTNRK